MKGEKRRLFNASDTAKHSARGGVKRLLKTNMNGREMLDKTDLKGVKGGPKRIEPKGIVACGGKKNYSSPRSADRL